MANEIMPGIFVGPAWYAARKLMLQTLNVTHILMVGDGLDAKFPTQYIYKHIPIDDLPDSNIAQYFAETNLFIDNALDKSGKILVHCRAGQSRSPTIVMAYMIWKYKMTYDAALAHFCTKHSHTYPNPGFVTQLRDYATQQQKRI